MTRYVALTPPKGSEDWETQPPIAAANTVYEPDDAPIETGLLDATGTKLYRIRDRLKMGYLPSILALFALLLATPALAEPKCAPFDQVEAMLAAEYQETRVAQGIVTGGEAMLALFASPQGTWTAVFVKADGMACFAAGGNDWQERHDAAPVPEESL